MLLSKGWVTATGRFIEEIGTTIPTRSPEVKIDAEKARWADRWTAQAHRYRLHGLKEVQHSVSEADSMVELLRAAAACGLWRTRKLPGCHGGRALRRKIITTA